MPTHDHHDARRAALARAARPVIGSTLFVASFMACSSNDLVAVPVPPPILCDTPTCIDRVPVAAIAVERTMSPDGGSCGEVPLKFSMPEGDDAFSSISSCGGNKIRCGAADYRISSSELSFDCTVSDSLPVHVSSHIEMANGTHFTVDGEVTEQGGTVTISAGTGLDGAATDQTECRVTEVPFLAHGSIWAKFDCNPDADGAACRLRGTFVLENCATRASDGG